MITKLDLEALRTETPQPVPWLVHGILAKGALTMLFGDPGTGKSMITLALGKAVAGGGSVIGMQAKETKGVILLDAENGKSEIHRRIHSLGITGLFTPCVSTGSFSIGVNLSILEDMLMEYPNTGLVILDSLRTLWPEGNENESKEVSPMLTALQQVARTFNVAILFIHHNNKSGNFRGSGALTAVPEIAVECGRHRRDKDESRRYLHWEKCRMDQAPHRKWFAIQSDDDGSVQVVQSWKPEAKELWPE